MSRLALLVPARNAEALLPRLFASVRAETEPFDEIWVFDDASTDRTGDVARAFGARVVRSDVNTGPSFGKNALARETRCDWVHFHDADDALHPEFVAHARQWMARSDVDVVLFATEDRDDQSDAPLGGRTWDDAALRTDAVRYAIAETITNCGVYRRDRFLMAGGFDLSADVKYNEDQAMHAQLALAGLRFRADALRGVVIYQRGGSMSSANRVACARAQVDLLVRMAQRTGDVYAPEIGERLWRLAGVCAGYSDWPYVRRALMLARRLGYRDPHREHLGVRLLARLSPTAAVAAREVFIRACKPALRVGMPSAVGR